MDLSKLFLLLVITVRDVVSRNPCTCLRKTSQTVNECADPALNNCDVNATCNDLPNGFSCTCNMGFTGDGTVCTELCNGTPCDPGENRTCYQDQTCVCTPGFHELNGTCVESCQNYSSTFINYPGSQLSCSPLLDIKELVASLSLCMSECSSMDNCISVVYDTINLFCFIYGCDPLFSSASFSSVGNDIITLVRNCD